VQIQKKKAQEEQAFSYAQRDFKSRSSQGRKEAKVGAFGRFKFFQVWEESLDAQEGATGTTGLGEESRSGPLNSYVQEEFRRTL
jgi:hypothetical protein